MQSLLPLIMFNNVMHLLSCLIFTLCIVPGSLGTSVFDMDAVLVGASGGVYALLAAHLANILLVSVIIIHIRTEVTS